MKKLVFTIFLLILFVNTTYALEECTPSDEYLKYMALSEEEKAKYIEPAYCKELTKKEEENDNFFVSFFKMLSNTISVSSTESYYNAVNDGLITTPQNQGGLGTCWAFSSISTVEANARKNNAGSYNFSEKHMIYSLLSAGYSDSSGQKNKYNTSNFDGGKVTYAASYYFNNYGQLLDNEWVYYDSLEKITSSQYKKGRKMISVGGFNLTNLGSYSSCSTDELSYIKEQIALYGSVQSSIYMNDNLFKDSQNNYYIARTSNSDLPNHGVSIVGWDDNISSSKFGASRNGAFIVKNSWGPSWSGDGYFYVSYDDNFICKNTASFYNVSSKTYDNTYASAEMIGVPTFMFEGTLYMSTRFTKKTSNQETLERVSFPVGENTNYYVYLVPDNNIYSSNNWQLLTEGTSKVYGIKSVDLNKTITNNFTIVTKYVPTKKSSVFTMCTNMSDTSLMEINSNTNYFASNLSNWSDMKSIPVQEGSISCEPNIFAYTNNKSSSTTQSIAINSTISNGNKIVVTITNNGVNTNNISYSITNSNNVSASSHFSISPNYSTNKITITADNKISGKYNFIIKYNGNEVKTTFTISESVETKNKSFINISDDKIFVNISNNYTLTYKKLLSGLNIYNSPYQVINKNGYVVNSNDSIIGTNSKIKLNNRTYSIVVLGDVNCDGKISAFDYLEVRKHIMGITISDKGKLQASDLDKNNKISALDYIAIRKILMR